MLSLSDNNQAVVSEAFKSTSRYLDDLLNYVVHNELHDSFICNL